MSSESSTRCTMKANAHTLNVNRNQNQYNTEKHVTRRSNMFMKQRQRLVYARYADKTRGGSYMDQWKASRRIAASASARGRRIDVSASAKGQGEGNGNSSSSYIDVGDSGHEIDNNPDGDMDAVLHARSKFRRVLCANRGEIAVRVFRGTSISTHCLFIQILLSLVTLVIASELSMNY